MSAPITIHTVKLTFLSGSLTSFPAVIRSKAVTRTTSMNTSPIKIPKLFPPLKLYVLFNPDPLDRSLHEIIGLLVVSQLENMLIENSETVFFIERDRFSIIFPDA